MSRYIVAVPVDPRFDKYKYVRGDILEPVFTDCVFDAMWYEHKVQAESVKDDLSREYHAIVLSLENTIQQLDRENGYAAFYILRDQSDNQMLRKVISPIHLALFTDNLKNTKKYKTAEDAMDAIAEINDCKYNPYDFVVEMHHFDEFYKQPEDQHFAFVRGGRGGGKTYGLARHIGETWLSENPNIAIPSEKILDQFNSAGTYNMRAKEMYNMFGIQCHLPEIEKVIFSNSVTIVLWKDGTKTIVRCQDGERFDPEKGLGMAFMKKAFGNKGNYFDKVRDLLNNATYQCDEVKTDRKDHEDRKEGKGCKDDAPLAKKTKRGTYKCPHCSRFIRSKAIEGKKGPFKCNECGKKFNINWKGELDYEF